MKNRPKVKWQLLGYDAVILLVVDLVMLVLYGGYDHVPLRQAAIHTAITFVCVFVARFIGKIYRQIWRYGGVQCYIRLVCADGAAFLCGYLLQIMLPIWTLTFVRALVIYCLNLLGSLVMRMLYRYAYKCAGTDTAGGRVLNVLLRMFAGKEAVEERSTTHRKIKVAIIGAGRVGTALAEELLNAAEGIYAPVCFVDINREKVGREVEGVPVLLDGAGTPDQLKEYEVQEVVFAIPTLSDQEKQSLYARYAGWGYRIKTYDYPVIQDAGKRRQLRDFDIEELLFRKQVVMSSDLTEFFYSGRTVLITGGGGSIGSELCRQLAKMKPKKLVILDICENTAYELQQELRLQKVQTELCLEIASITNRAALERVFAAHHPEIVIHAAAHKHVPLMEHNCIEAVENNVFGTALLVELCVQHGVERFMMVSTDKAVNPTNVMGATKRLCEMIVLSAAQDTDMRCSATRFGNVLGSAGSVIPLFKRQIAAGGPVTVTDRRIVRYFMTIPEAAQLVLQSGSMAKNGELFVLDMGEPVKIQDLAESMILLSGRSGIEIVETGLRPGEKLYEELLVNTDTMTKTENELIFIERDIPCTRQELQEKLALLRRACATGEDEAARLALRQVVPTYKSPEEVNGV